jgi:hypothetical protein
MEANTLLETATLPGLRALVIEDDPFWSSWFTSMIKSLDKAAQISVVDSVTSAERAVGAAPMFDLIVCDHLLRGNRTGLDFYRELQKQRSTTPFLLTSGLTREQIDAIMENDNECASPIFIDKQSCNEGFREIVTQMIASPTEKNLVPAETDPMLVLMARDRQLQEVVEMFW